MASHPNSTRARGMLIARFSALGDIVMMQPVVTALRTTYGEDAVVDLCALTAVEAAHLLSGIDRCTPSNAALGEVLEALRERHYDYLLDLHGTVRSRSLARSLDVLTFSVDKQAWNRWRLIRGWRSAPVPFFIDRCLDVVRPFGVEPPAPASWGAQAWGSLKASSDAANAGGADAADLVVSLGSSHPGKHLSNAVVDAALRAAQSMNARVVLVGGEAERARAEALASLHAHVIGGGRWIWPKPPTPFPSQSRGDRRHGHHALAAATGRPTAAGVGMHRPSLGLAGWHGHP